MFSSAPRKLFFSSGPLFADLLILFTKQRVFASFVSAASMRSVARFSLPLSPLHCFFFLQVDARPLSGRQRPDFFLSPSFLLSSKVAGLGFSPSVWQLISFYMEAPRK